MIDFVRGQIVYTQEDTITVDVNGIGYRIFVPTNLTGQVGEEVTLYTHLVVREDAQTLYGFFTKDERDLFRLLIEASGVGPKAALGILSYGTPAQIVSAIRFEDTAFLTKIPGVGKKTAQRLILDLKDKCKQWVMDSTETGLQEQSISRSLPADQEAVEALMGLGYNEHEANQAVQFALENSDEQELSTEELIKKALQVSMRS